MCLNDIMLTSTVDSDVIWTPFTFSCATEDAWRRYTRNSPTVTSLRLQSCIPILLFCILAKISAIERLVGGILLSEPLPAIWNNCPHHQLRVEKTYTKDPINIKTTKLYWHYMPNQIIIIIKSVNTHHWKWNSSQDKWNSITKPC